MIPLSEHHLARQATPQSDDEWAASIRAGDRTAFERLFRTFYVELVRFVEYQTSNRAEAEDIVQTTYEVIWEHREKWLPRGSMKAYLYGAAHRQAATQFRRLKGKDRWLSHLRIDEIPPFTSETGPEDEYRFREIEKEIEHAISALPERQRCVFRLSRNLELSYAEIAALLEISPKTVENQIVRAIKSIRRRLYGAPA